MKIRYISSLIILSALGLSAPAMAVCHLGASASSTSESCESGVKVYRGQQNGPDIRYAILQQNRDIAESRARAAEARAREAQARVRQAPIMVTQTNNGNRRFLRRNLIVPLGRFRFRNFGNVSSPLVGGGFGAGFVGSVPSGAGPALGINVRPIVGAVPGARSSALSGGN